MVRKKKAFTLIEVVIAIGIMAVAFLGLVAAYISSFELAETAKNTTYALNAAQKKIEEIRDYNFFDIPADYDNTNFTVDGISAGNSNGLVEIDDSAPELLVVTVTACWKQKGGRIIGGDAALTPLSTSPVRLVTYIADR